MLDPQVPQRQLEGKYRLSPRQEGPVPCECLGVCLFPKDPCHALCTERSHEPSLGLTLRPQVVHRSSDPGTIQAPDSG